MRSVVLVFASLALLAQAPAPANSNQPANSWASIWAKVPEPLKTALANSPLVFNGGPPHGDPGQTGAHPGSVR